MTINACIRTTTRFLFASTLVFSSLSQVGNASEVLLPDRGYFEYNKGIAVTLDGTTAIVANDLDQSLYVFSQDSTGTFSKESLITIVAGEDNHFGFIELRGNTLVVWAQTDYPTRLETFIRNASGQWLQDSTAIQDVGLFRGFRLSQDGNRLIVIKSDKSAELYKRVGNGWVLEFAAVPVNWSFSERSFCISDDMAIAGLSVYHLDDSNQWQDLGPRELEAGSITLSSNGSYLFSNSYTRPHYSSDCKHAIVRAVDEIYSTHIFSLDDSYQWSRGSEFYNDRYFYQADINEQYAVVRHQNSGNQLTVYKNNGNGTWLELGNLHTVASQVLIGDDFSLSGNTLITSNIAPGIAEVYDLSSYDFQSSPIRSCGIGFSDQNNTGYGWENNATCVIPESELAIGDTRRDNYLSVERTYSGPTSVSIRQTEGYSHDSYISPEHPQLNIDEPVAVSGNRAAKAINSDDEQLLVEFYLRTNNQWQLESTIDIAPLIRPESFTYPIDLSFNANTIRLNLDGNTMALALRANTPDFVGVVYMFERSDSNGWQFHSEIPRPQVGVWYDYAGAIALSENELAVRSGDVGGEGGGGPGIVHMYRKQDSGDWQRYTDIVDVRPGEPSTPFGKSLALENDRLLVASDTYTDVYQRQANGTWEAQQVLFTGDGTDTLPVVHLSNDTALILHSGKTHSFSPDASGYMTPGVVFTGGDLIINSGGLWSADVNPATVTTDNLLLYPVAFAEATDSQSNNSTTQQTIPDSTTGEITESTDTICIDTDGDGWGWDGTTSCSLTTEPSIIPSAPETQCVDTDGDGWGWDGAATCQIFTQAVDSSVTAELCIDTDGDGWGWDGTNSCTINTAPVDSPAATTSPLCIDTDGDGWGWDGTDSCRIVF